MMRKPPPIDSRFADDHAVRRMAMRGKGRAPLLLLAATLIGFAPRMSAAESQTPDASVQEASFDAAGPTVAGDFIFVNAGYGLYGSRPGNVLAAFAPGSP
jgi:hypothetical protein